MGMAIDIGTDIGDELARQIERRTRILGETTSQAVVGIAMQTLRSLRAATPKSKGNLRPVADRIEDEDMGISVEEAPQYAVGFRQEGKVRKPCIRHGRKGTVADIRPWWKVNVNSDMYGAKVYKVTLSKGRQKAWPKQRPHYWMVAKSLESARRIVTKRYQRLVRRYAGTGRGTWTMAMRLVAGNGQKMEVTAKAESVVSRVVRVDRQMQGYADGSVSITVDNSLGYLPKLVPESFVRNALMKALNSTNGMVNRWIEKHDAKRWFDEIGEKPFPKEAFQ